MQRLLDKNPTSAAQIVAEAALVAKVLWNALDGNQARPKRGSPIKACSSAIYLAANRTVDRPLRQHIIELEKRVQQLNQDIMQNRKTREERNRMEAELRVAQQALQLYQRTIHLEGQLQRS